MTMLSLFPYRVNRMHYLALYKHHMCIRSFFKHIHAQMFCINKALVYVRRHKHARQKSLPKKYADSTRPKGVSVYYREPQSHWRHK